MSTTKISGCRSCDSDQLTRFLDLGDQRLADFRPDKSKPPKLPLAAVFCENCKLVQLDHPMPQDEMYHERYGFKSGISDSIKRDLDDIVTHAFQYKSEPKSWLDIASNDGTLLSFVPDDIYRVGVDPVGFLCKEAEQNANRIVNAYFSATPFVTEYGENGEAIYEKFDVITSISCFYDMPDPNKFVDDVKKVLAHNGVWVIQQNYLLSTLEISAVDNFCHEHLEYYTLLSLENLLKRHGLEVNEVLISDVNGGSIRTIVSRVGTFPIDESVYGQRSLEEEAGVADSYTYMQFANKMMTRINELHCLVDDLRLQGKTIAILAASTRGSTIWQSACLTPEMVDYAVERNPAKVGKWFSPIGIPIISEQEFRLLQPDYAIIGPWFFKDEIIAREQEYANRGGKFIMPLPEVKII